MSQHRTVRTLVVGAGVIGAAAAWQAAQRGSVVLLEPHGFLHELGSSHGGSRIFRHAYEDREHVRLALQADVLWLELERLTGERLLHRHGGLDIGRRSRAELDPIAASLAAEGRPFERLAADEAMRRYPALSLDEDAEALFSPDAAIVPATRAVATLLRAAASAGAELIERAPLRSWRAVAGGVEVESDQGVFRAERLVLAPGPWLPKLVPELGLPIHIEQQQVLYLRVGGAARHFTAERLPLFVDRRGGIYGFPIFERPDAIKVSDRQGAPTIELDERTFELWPERAEATIKAATTLFPTIEGSLLSSQMCWYTKTRDELFVLDHHPDAPQVVIAGGGSGHAFKFGPALGRIAVELAWGEAPSFDPALFSLTRWA